MASYELEFKKSVAKDLRVIPKKDLLRILKRIQALANDPRPRGCQKLSEREIYRVRQGIYRILYEIKDDILVIIVVKVGSRGDVYK